VNIIHSVDNILVQVSRFLFAGWPINVHLGKLNTYLYTNNCHYVVVFLNWLYYTGHVIIIYSLFYVRIHQQVSGESFLARLDLVLIMIFLSAWTYASMLFTLFWICVLLKLCWTQLNSFALALIRLTMHSIVLLVRVGRKSIESELH